jgi:hypothetical protein
MHVTTGQYPWPRLNAGACKRTTLLRASVFFCVLSFLSTRPIAAQTSTGVEPATEPAPVTHRIDWAPHLYVTMWTVHLKTRPLTLRNNWVVGFSARGFFGATFINSFGHRAFTGGLQRSLIGTTRPTTNVMLGYRLGFVTGYDGRLIRLARETPVLPLIQPFVAIDVKRIGFEVQYTFVVVSAAMSFRF